MTLEILTKTDLLKITKPEDMFTVDGIGDEYKLLAKKWHPDILGGDVEVMQKINTIYQTGLDKIKADVWGQNKLMITFKGKDGKSYKIRYSLCDSFEIGNCYHTDKKIFYFIPEIHSKFGYNSKRISESIKFPDRPAEKNLSKTLNLPKQFIELEDGYLFVIEKETPWIFLSDLIRVEKDIPVKTVAWILSRLYNISCLFEYNKINHNDISINNCIVNLESHEVIITSFWFSTFFNQSVYGIPKRTFNTCQKLFTVTDDKYYSSHLVDLELIKTIGRELLGDSTGVSFMKRSDIPPSLRLWLTIPSTSETCVEEFKKWGDVLKESWGERKFFKYTIDIGKIYQ